MKRNFLFIIIIFLILYSCYKETGITLIKEESEKLAKNAANNENISDRSGHVSTAAAQGDIQVVPEPG